MRPRAVARPCAWMTRASEWRTCASSSTTRQCAPCRDWRTGNARPEGNRAPPPSQPRAPAPLRFSDPHRRRPAMTRILPHDHDHRFATRAVHAGQVPEPLSGAVMTPDLPDLDLRAGGPRPPQGLRVRPDPESHPGGAGAQRGRARGRRRHGFAFGSGLAALDAVLKLLRSRRPRRLRRERLRRHPPPDGADLQPSSALHVHLRGHARRRATSSGRSRRPPGWSTARRPPTR